jgi:hypothetical protein
MSLRRTQGKIPTQDRVTGIFIMLLGALGIAFLYLTMGVTNLLFILGVIPTLFLIAYGFNMAFATFMIRG